jgi:L-fuconolactonase
VTIDSHQHFWRYSAAEYPWIPVDSPLQRDWLPADLESLQRPIGFDGSVAVQARQSLEETHWLLDLADAHPRVLGVVGWADLRAPGLDDVLHALAARQRLRGLRHVAQDEPDDEFLARPEFIRGVGRLHAFGLAYDILIYPRQLPAALRLVESLPDQTFILDHVAKPYIRKGEIQPWRDQIRALAAHPKVFCKVSGMVTEADHARWTPEQLQPYVDVVMDAFGPGRLMFGSDWPVCLLGASYARWFEAASGLLKGLSPADRAAVFGGNAQQAYGLKE